MLNGQWQNKHVEFKFQIVLVTSKTLKYAGKRRTEYRCSIIKRRSCLTAIIEKSVKLLEFNVTEIL